MKKSFALIWNEEYDYVNLLQETEKHFNVNFRSITPNHASGINNEMQFMVDISPNKLHFKFPRDAKEQNLTHAMEHIKSFAKYQFENQTIGIKYYDDRANKATNLDIEGVRTVLL